MFSSFVLKKEKANNIYVSGMWNVEKAALSYGAG